MKEEISSEQRVQELKLEEQINLLAQKRVELGDLQNKYNETVIMREVSFSRYQTRISDSETSCDESRTFYNEWFLLCTEVTNILNQENSLQTEINNIAVSIDQIKRSISANFSIFKKYTISSLLEAIDAGTHTISTDTGHYLSMEDVRYLSKCKVAEFITNDVYERIGKACTTD
jgi:hypothetical protein